MREKYFNHKGLSLVEVVVAALLVAVLLAGLYAVYINAKNLAVLALHKTVARAWAESVIEGFRNGMRDSYDDPAIPNTLTILKGVGGPNTATADYGPMRRHSVSIDWVE